MYASIAMPPDISAAGTRAPSTKPVVITRVEPLRAMITRSQSSSTLTYTDS